MMSLGIRHQLTYPHQTSPSSYPKCSTAELLQCFQQPEYIKKKKKILLVVVPTYFIFTCKSMILIILVFLCWALLTLEWIVVRDRISKFGLDGVNLLHKFSCFCSSYSLPCPTRA